MKIRLLFLSFLICSLLRAQTSYVTENNIAYYPDSMTQRDGYIALQCRLDLYYPKEKKDFATIIWFHGGGLTAGGKELPKALMEKGYAVVGVGYRLSPKAKAPAYIEDAAAAIAWVMKNMGRYGGASNLIFLSGHSAGGYLDLMVGLDKKYLRKYGLDPDSLAGLIPFSAQAVTHFTVRQERGIPQTQAVIDSLAPIYHTRATAPPLLLITGDREKELLGRYEENAYLHRMMILSGHTKTRSYELDGFDHEGMAEPAFPLLFKEVAAIIKGKTGAR